MRTHLPLPFHQNPRGGIVVVKGYHSASTGTVEDVWLNVGCSWERTLQRSAATLATFTVAQVAAESPTCQRHSKLDALDLAAQALAALKQSVNKALAGTTRPSPYRGLAPGLYVKAGDSLYDYTAPLYVRGLFNGRYVIEPGEHKVVRSKDLTLVKRWVEKDLARSKYMTLKLDWRSFSQLSVNRQRFTPADLFVNSQLPATMAG
jgi:hypothetical protein